MKTELKCILLIDDNEDDNFYHEREIGKYDSTIKVISMEMCKDALECLKAHKDNVNELPDLIFLDINLPLMNGWEFLRRYVEIKNELKKFAKVIVLTTSDNPDDVAKSKAWDVVIDYYTKPLTKEKFSEIVQKHFN